MDFKRIFKKWDKRKKPGGESRESPSRTETPSPQSSIRSTSPRPVPSGALSALVLHSSTQMQISPPVEYRTTEVPSTSSDAWTNLAAFLDILSHAPVFAPLATVVDDLSWFVRAHENAVSTRDEYKALHIQLELTFKDLGSHFSDDAPPMMTTSMLNLCGAIQMELTGVYGTQERNTISRYMQANQDLDKITECYRRIQAHLERLMLNASLSMWKTLDTHEARLDRINPSMSACYDSAEANIVQRRECAPKTRVQVLSELESWKNNPDGEKVCWINGMAGTGKTTIATSLCATLSKSHELGASFFCTRSIPACRDVKLILPTIAYQLAGFSSPFRGALLQVLSRDLDVHTKMPRVQFQRMILKPLQDVIRSLPSIVVVIDALDECDDGSGVSQILEVLLENASSLPVKFIVSSRPEHHIRERIRRSALNTQLILHELDEKMVKEDIETYLRTELALMSVPLADSQLTDLVERAGVLFIYAATVVRYIKAGDPLGRLDAMLNAPRSRKGPSNRTKEIDALYRTVLTSAFSNDDLEDAERGQMQLVLHTVVCAQEPLAAAAVAGLLGLTPAQVMAALQPLWSVLHLSTSDASHQISTLHASFPDYMLDPARSKEFACSHETHNGRLAELCLMRISRNTPQFNICKLESSYVFDEDIREMDEKVKQSIPMDLMYASQYWATHLYLGEKLNERATELHEFLSKRLLLWMEVLNLSKRISRAIGQIEAAITWLQTIEPSGGTVSLARDALRFVTMFATSPVSRSTPHLYVSMIASWPEYQPLSRCYLPQTKDLVRMKGIEISERQLSLLSLTPAGSPINCIAYSPTGTFFAAGTQNKQVLVWDAVSCRMTIDPIEVHDDEIQAIAISPDGTQICSGSHDHTLRVWDPQSGRPIAGPLKGHTNWVRSVAYSPNTFWLASASDDGTVHIWSTRDWQTKGTPLNGGDRRATSVVFSPDSSTIAAGYESTIHIWDIAGNRPIGEPIKGHTAWIGALAFMPGGKHLVSGSEDHTIRIWDIGTGQMAFKLPQGHISEVECLTVSPNAKLLASAATDNTIRIWDTNSWTTRSVFRHTGVAKGVAFSPDGSRLVSGSVDGNARVWEVPDATDARVVESRAVGHSAFIRSIAFSPCGSYIISGSQDTTARMWDVQSGQPLGNPLEGHNDWVTRVGVSADSNHIFTVSIDRMIHVWDSKVGQLEYTIGPIETDGNHDPSYLEDWPAIFLFDARRVICGSESGRIYVREDNKLVHELVGHRAAIYSLALSPDGQSFVSGDDKGKLIIWDLKRGEKIRAPIRAHSDCIYSVAFSPDGVLVASGCIDNTIRLWNAQPGPLLAVGNILQGHTDAVHSVAFSHDSELLVSGSQDKTVRVWSVASGRSVAVFEGHTDMIYSVTFSPDKTRIASGSADMAIRVWNAPVSADVSNDDDCKDQPGSIAEDDHSLSWTMDESGWVQDSEHQLLVWLPPDLRSTLLRSQNTMLISRQGSIELDFSDARIGESWATCYEAL